MSDDFFSPWSLIGPNGIISPNNLNNPANPNGAYQQILRLQAANRESHAQPGAGTHAAVGLDTAVFLVLLFVGAFLVLTGLACRRPEKPLLTLPPKRRNPRQP